MAEHDCKNESRVSVLESQMTDTRAETKTNSSKILKLLAWQNYTIGYFAAMSAVVYFAMKFLK